MLGGLIDTPIITANITELFKIHAGIAIMNDT